MDHHNEQEIFEMEISYYYRKCNNHILIRFVSPAGSVLR